MIRETAKIGMLNINGMKNEIVMTNLKKRMEKSELEILFLTEPLLSRERQRELKQIFDEYDIFVRVRKPKKRNKKYKERGGIVCIAKKGAVTLEKETRHDDIMWVDWGGIKIACAYFVPQTSLFHKKNEKRMIELQQRALEYSGKVMIMTDSNAHTTHTPRTHTHAHTTHAHLHIIV